MGQRRKQSQLACLRPWAPTATNCAQRRAEGRTPNEPHLPTLEGPHRARRCELLLYQRSVRMCRASGRALDAPAVQAPQSPACRPSASSSRGPPSSSSAAWHQRNGAEAPIATARAAGRAAEEDCHVEAAGCQRRPAGEAVHGPAAQLCARGRSARGAVRKAKGEPCLIHATERPGPARPAAREGRPRLVGLEPKWLRGHTYTHTTHTYERTR